MSKVIIGIDLGGTHLRIGAVTRENVIENLSVIKSHVIADAKEPVQKLCRIIREYIEGNQITQIGAISIGVPSSVAADKETVICTTNIRNRLDEPVFSHMNIARVLRAEFHVPVYINNDVQNILLYDTMKNNLQEKAVLVGIYIGTGAGAAVLINGKPLVGKDGVALDIGDIPYFHADMDKEQKDTRCERFASGWRLQQIRKKYYPDTPIKDLFAEHGDDLPMREFVHACAHIFAVMATIFNPDAIIAGGGVIEMDNFPRERFKKAIETQTGGDVMSYGFDLLYSEDILGKGVIGAAIFAEKMMERSV